MRTIITSLIIEATPPHQHYFAALNVSSTAAKNTGFGAIDLLYRHPVVVDFAVLVLDIINVKYIHLNDIDLFYDSQKDTSLSAINLQFLPPTMSALCAIDIQHRQLRSLEISALEILQMLVPTTSRYFKVNLQADKLPHSAFGILDVAFGFPYLVINTGFPLTTFWSKNLRTEVTGSASLSRKISNVNIFSVYESTERYDGNDLGSKILANIRTAIGRVHNLKTDIYLDFDSWYTRYSWVPTSIETAATQVCGEATHLFVLGGVIKKQPTSVIAKFGLYNDTLKVSDTSIGFADNGISKVWLNQQALLGYTNLTKQVNYGFFVTIPNNIANYVVDTSWLGIPLTGTNLLDLDITINLFSMNTINFNDYKTPTVFLNLYGAITGVNGTVRANMNYAYIDITELTKKHQELFTGGDMVLQVMPSSSLIYADTLLHKPFLYRMFTINTTGNFIYKIFNKQEIT